jgi:hypothetical protein
MNFRKKYANILMLLILAYLFSDIFLINLNHHNYIPSISASPATIILRPNGPGDSTQLYQYPTTGENWEKVDDGIPDGDATYVYIIEDNALDLYAIEDPPINIGIINSVTIYAYCRKERGSPDLYICIRTHGTTYEFGPYGLSPGYEYYSSILTTNPYTNQPWTWDEINDLQAGVRLDASKGKNWEARCTQLYVVVDYTIPQYKLNLRIKDYDLIDNIQNARVYVTNATGTYSKLSDINGWANFTSYGNTNVKVEYYGFWVNGTFTINVDSDKTIDVKCNLYDVTFNIKDNNNHGYLVGANVTIFNSTNKIEKNKICSGITNSIGQVVLMNLPNNTLNIVVYDGAPSPSIIGEVEKLISYDGQIENIICNPWATSNNFFSIYVHIAAIIISLPIAILSIINIMKRKKVFFVTTIIILISISVISYASIALIYPKSTINIGVKERNNIVYVKPDSTIANSFSESETFYRSVKNVIANTSYGIRNTASNNINIALSIDSISDITKITYFNITLIDSISEKKLSISWKTGDSLPKQSFIYYYSCSNNMVD